MPSIWNKYKKIREITNKKVKSNLTIKTYLTRIEPIVKEINPKEENDYYTIIEKLKLLKEEFNIYEIIEENEKIYIVIDNDEEILSKIDNLILSNKIDIQRECIIQGHGSPISKEEIYNLFKLEKSMCKIYFENPEGKQSKASGFFCEIDYLPFKYALFTNNHVLNESNIETGNIITFEYFSEKKGKIDKRNLIIKDDRKVFTNKELDYTCIELIKSDNILNYFKIEPKLFKNDDITFLKNNDIFILQYPGGKDISFSYGKILSLGNWEIKHSASTECGSSGSPIIRRSPDNYIIGLHFGGYGNKFNLATIFNLIINDIKNKLPVVKYKSFNKTNKINNNILKNKYNKIAKNDDIEINNLKNHEKNNNFQKKILNHTPIKNINKFNNFTEKKTINSNLINRMSEQKIKYNLNKIKNNKYKFNTHNKKNNNNIYIETELKKDLSKEFENKIKDIDIDRISKNTNKFNETKKCCDEKNIILTYNFSNENIFRKININKLMIKEKAKKNYIPKCINNNPITVENNPKTNLNDNRKIYTNTNIKNRNNKKIDEGEIINLLKNYPNFEKDEFQYIKNIGKGSFGEILLVKEKKTNNEYAIKRIKCNNFSELLKYINEFDILYHSNNEHIIKAYKYNLYKSKKNDIVTINFDILMERGICDWSQEIFEKSRQEKKQYYSTRKIFLILSQLTSGFYYLQQKNIAHRDIKPQNILIFPGNVYKIADFSEAITSLNSESKAQRIKGTLNFMSPTLFNGLKFGDNIRKYNPFKSDVFSLGLCFLYAMTLNNGIFSFFDGIRNNRGIYNENEIKRIIEFNYDVSEYSPRLLNIIYKMISIEEKDRYDFIKLKESLPIVV